MRGAAAASAKMCMAKRRRVGREADRLDGDERGLMPVRRRPSKRGGEWQKRRGENRIRM